MDEKLKKVALKLSKKYKSSSVFEAYIKFMDEVSANEEYFSRYTPDQLVKIPIYIYSIIETNGFDLGDSMIKNAWIGNIFEFGADDYDNEQCDNCDASGYISCDECEGGSAQCGHCDGDGKVECDTCDGIGVDDDGDGTCDNCNGNGEVDCDWCDGEGTVSCRNCNGDGSLNCDDCDGSGEIESSKLKYWNTTIIVWDKKLINMFMNSYELEKPISNQDLTRFINQSQMSYLQNIEDAEEFKTEVKPDKKYCFYFEKFLSGGLKLQGNQLTTGKIPTEYIYR